MTSSIGLRRLATGLALVLSVAASPARAAALCADCMRVDSSVKNAAGTNPKERARWAAELARLRFEGDGLTAGSAAAVRAVAAPFVGGSSRLVLKVRADARLARAQAEAQARARAAALQQALVNAGVPADRVSVQPVRR